MNKNKGGRPQFFTDPAVAGKAVSLLARGESIKAAAKAAGCSRQTASRWASQDEVQAWVAAESEKYIASLPDALAISQNLLQAGRSESGKLLRKKPGEVDHKVLELATREAESLRKAVGLQPCQTGAVLIQNIYQDNRQIISPAVQDLISAHLGLSGVVGVTPETEDEHEAEGVGE